MNRFVASAVCVLAYCSSFGQTKEICFTFDDLPVVSYELSDTASQARLFMKLLNSLAENQIPAIGFVNEEKLFDVNGLEPFQVGLLDSWIRNGLDLGNHTFSHPDFNKVGCSEFFDDILKGEKVTKELLRQKGKKMRYFRHPFLHVGNNRAKADSLNQFLDQHGYRTAPVTIDNDDYLFARAFADARLQGDSVLARRLGKDYVSYMQEKLRYFERQAKSLFGRSIRQILLIHASLLNAEYLDSLAAMCRQNGYRFVDIDRALEDQAYTTPVTVYGNWGISWIDRWAMSRGKPTSFFRDEPRVPEYLD